MHKILIVEDDLLLADMAEDLVCALGYEVCGIAQTIVEAIALGELHQPNIAIIDMRLANGELGTDLAEKLTERIPGIGVLYATGNCAKVLQAHTKGHGCIGKPYRDTDLKRALEIITEMTATGTATPPFPRGFRLLSSAGPASQAFGHG
jgi:CheY-like chemotaxis protein